MESNTLNRSESVQSEDQNELIKLNKRKLLAEKIKLRLKELNITGSKLAEMVKKNPSEISKWLSGTHNFTVDTLFEIEEQLKFSLVHTELFKSVKNGIRQSTENDELDDFLNRKISQFRATFIISENSLQNSKG